VCKRECEDNVLGCDGCDSWFHADCLKIEDLDELPDKYESNNADLLSILYNHATLYIPTFITKPFIW
jgi:hypothetical protein